MHIVADSESISKYGLQNLLDSRQDASITLSQFMDLLGLMPPAMQAKAVNVDPWYPVLVEFAKLRATVDVLAKTVPLTEDDRKDVGYFTENAGEAWCAVWNLSASFIRSQASKAAAGTADGADAEDDLARMIREAKALYTRARAILAKIPEARSEAEAQAANLDGAPTWLRDLWERMPETDRKAGDETAK